MSLDSAGDCPSDHPVEDKMDSTPIHNNTVLSMEHPNLVESPSQEVSFGLESPDPSSFRIPNPDHQHGFFDYQQEKTMHSVSTVS